MSRAPDASEAAGAAQNITPFRTRRLSRQTSHPKQRPALVTWLSLGVLTLGVFSLGGWAAGLTLPDLPYAAPRPYLLLRNALWAAWGFATATGAFLGRNWAPKLLRFGGLFGLVWYWADRLLLSRSQYARTSWPVSAALSALAIAVLVWILSRPRVSDYFQERLS